VQTESRRSPTRRAAGCWQTEEEARDNNDPVRGKKQKTGLNEGKHNMVTRNKNDAAGPYSFSGGRFLPLHCLRAERAESSRYIPTGRARTPGEMAYRSLNAMSDYYNLDQ